MQSKIILAVTAALTICPHFIFISVSFRGTYIGTLMNALFQHVAPRTAGFNTADLTVLSETGQMIVIALMLIGGAPGKHRRYENHNDCCAVFIRAVGISSKRIYPLFNCRVPNGTEKTLLRQH